MAQPHAEREEYDNISPSLSRHRHWPGQQGILFRGCGVAGVNQIPVHLQHGQVAVDESPGNSLLRSFAARLPEKQVANDDGNGRIDQFPAAKVEIGRTFRFDELHRLVDDMPGIDEPLLHAIQQRIVVRLASCGSTQVSSEPEVTPRTAATTCNWLVPS